MKEFSIKDAVSAVNGKYFGNDHDLAAKIKGVAIDNRKIEDGYLFVPIKGDRFDGHDFIESAFSSGAICTLASRKINTDYPYILVEDTVAAFRDLAEFYKSLFDIKTVGITGSVGKTTTKEMVYSVLSQKLNTLYTQGNLNNQTGVPLTVFRLEKHNEAAVIEMGTNHFGEIANVAKVARPDFCLITNIGEAHIEFLKSRSGILKAKTEMLEFMKEGGTVFVNGDDEYLKTLKQKRSDVVSFGLNDDNDIVAKDIKTNGLFGSSFVCKIGENSYPVEVPSPGLHMIYNAMAGIAVGRAFGLDMDSIIKGVGQYRPISGRMNISVSGGITILDDVYNANPDSLRAAINVLAFAEGRKVCIMGDMFELGDESDAKHYSMGQYAAAKGIDIAVCVGEKMKFAADGMKDSGGDAVYFRTQEDMLGNLASIINQGDSVLVKASHGMHLENTVEWLRNIK